jgi:hypothetical protein
MRIIRQTAAFILLLSLTAFCGMTIKQAAFAEAAGSGWDYSLNYELQLQHTQWVSTAFRAGFGYWYSTASFIGGSWVSTPVSLSLLAGPGNHKLELGLGYNPFFIDTWASHLICPIIGYQYQHQPKGLLFRLTFTPLIFAGNTDGFLPWGGASIGWLF